MSILEQVGTQSIMIKVIFFVENNWAFGSIHNNLCKEFYKRGIDSEIIDWRIPYPDEDFKVFIDSCEIIFTLPSAITYLIGLGVNPNRIVVVAHEEENVCELETCKCFIPELRSYGVISSGLVNFSKSLGIERVPKLVRYGINFNYFYRKPREILKNIGYGGAKASLNRFGIDRKRGYLVDRALNNVKDINLIAHRHYNFLCMPSYYSSIDGVIISSCQEACGLPILEGAASGCLIIGSNIGYLKEYGEEAGVILPIEEDLFVNELEYYLNYFRDNPKEYKIKCESIQYFARQKYDWSLTIQDWIDLLG